MKHYLLILLPALILFGCKSSPKQEQLTIYESENLIINQLSDHVFMHTTYLNTESFGKVVCNGMIVLDKNEALVFDTPTDNKTSEELIQWINLSLKSKIVGIVPTHFHEDCLGGLEAFHQHNIPSYSNNETIEFARNDQATIPVNGFTDSLALQVGDKKVYLEYFGEGHTKDNITAFFPNDNILFGGCLIKETGATKGNLADANPSTWPNTVRKLKTKHPNIQTIIPGHGAIGGQELLDYTISIFENH